MKKKEILIFLIFVLLSLLVAYIYSGADFNNRVQYVEQDIRGRVKNIELIQNVIADMPALLGSIEFQSYGQVDIIIEKLMSEDEVIKDFFVLDGELNVLHLKQSNYESDIANKKSFAGWSKENPYINHQDSIYMLKRVGASLKSNPFFIMFRISLAKLFEQKLADSGVEGVFLKSYFEVTPFQKFELEKSILHSARMDFFFTYLLKNILGLLIVIILTTFIFILSLKWLINPFREITFYLQNLSNKNIEHVKLEQYPRIFKPFIANIIEANHAIVTSFQREREIEIQQSQFKVAQQVAHDIRSPLGVLKAIKPEISILSEDVRRVVQMSINRIEEITLNLLRTNESVVVEKEVRAEELLSLVENVLIEKRIEFRNSQIEILGTFDTKSYGLFSTVRRSFLKRIVSNIINNSVEAIGERPGLIEVSLFHDNSWNIIRVKDNGPGIAKDNISKLFEKGFTTKKMGNGLGLSGAKEEIEKIGGRIEVVAAVGEGTIVNIYVPKADRPLSFAKSIDLFRYKKVIVLDDDYSIHEIWDKKIKGKNCIVEHFYSSKEILDKYHDLEKSTLLLSDFELIGESCDGIDVINKLNHAENSILITARSEEPEILERCFNSRISFLSKTLIPYISIKEFFPQIILIDDDKLCHWRWEDFCKEKGVLLHTYFSIDEFIKSKEKIKKDDFIFLDSDLGNGVKGEIDGEVIYHLGFSNLYISTNYPEGKISKPLWIKSILSKNPNEAFVEIEW